MNHFDKNKPYKDWIAAKHVKFDIGVCLHTPKRLRAIERGYDEDWLRRKLQRYLNELDRRLFKTQYLRHNRRLNRFVVLGYTETVGWHAHLLIVTPPELSSEKLIPMMKLLWEKHMEVTKMANKAFKDKLFWAEPIYGNYAHYSVDNANESQHNGINVSAATHRIPANNNGVVDILNCHF